MLILDFRKAFDTVAHQRPIHKLEHYGIRYSIKGWISTWLTTRTQKVVVDGESSTEAQVRSGFPQGTILGPVMFLLYINDIGHKTSKGTLQQGSILDQPCEESHVQSEPCPGLYATQPLKPPPYGRTSRVWDSLLVMKSGCAGGRGFAPRPGQ